jgi:hypothetical protein
MQTPDVIKKEIESKTEKQLKSCITNNTQQTINNLQNVMQKGADEFEQKMGRPMTYSEMRSMYG